MFSWLIWTILSFSRMLDQINNFDNGQYYYLCDSNGEIIYHPRRIQISDGISSENSAAAAGYRDGIYDETFEGEARKVVVNTISYTGWKLVGVIPYSAFTYGMINMRYFIIMLMLLMAMMLAVVNRIVSVGISRPILKLNDSVKEYEAGEKPEIYIGGPQEIRHLGLSIQKSYEQIEDLMKKIVLEQNERRKSELDALQSQINPHFLYKHTGIYHLDDRGRAQRRRGIYDLSAGPSVPDQSFQGTHDYQYQRRTSACAELYEYTENSV